PGDRHRQVVCNIDHGATAGHVGHDAVESVAETAARGDQGLDPRRQARRAADAAVGREAAALPGPLRVELHAGDDAAPLEVEAGLAAGQGAAQAAGAVTR